MILPPSRTRIIDNTILTVEDMIAEEAKILVLREEITIEFKRLLIEDEMTIRIITIFKLKSNCLISNAELFVTIIIRLEPKTPRQIKYNETLMKIFDSRTFCSEKVFPMTLWILSGIPITAMLVRISDVATIAEKVPIRTESVIRDKSIQKI